MTQPRSIDKRPRVALVTNLLAHYRVPCFHHLVDRMPGQITFFLLTEKMDHRHYVMAEGSDGLPVVRLPGWRWSRPPHDDIHLNDIRPVLRGRFDAVILGAWDEPTYLLLWMGGMFFRQNVMFWVESTAEDGPRCPAKERMKKVLLSRSKGCIVPGKRAFSYCRQLGQAEDRIFTAPNATDRVFFRGQADRLFPIREGLRSEERVQGFVILFTGRLVDHLKSLSTLIKACGWLEKNGRRVSLLVAGDGPDKRSYQELGSLEGLKDIRFLGTLDHHTLCRYYAMADVFVLPSRSEPWGFVLNEGMEFGLPLVVSEAVGAGPDLVRHGENGFIFPVGDVSSLARDLAVLVDNESLRHRMGQTSRSIIEAFSPENWANGVMQAIEAVMK
jgi:glycosyltransferase involved in cell wall biosynthesis